MHAPLCVFLVSLALLFVSLVAALDVDELDLSIYARAWNPPELAKVGQYWRSYAKRRLDATDRCERRLALYLGRLKMAQDVLGAVNKRNSDATTVEIKTLKQETSVAEINLMGCVSQIINQQPDDPFYKDYQLLNTELQRLTDQVASCIEAGGTVSTARKRQVDTQAVPESSPQMRRIYENMKQKKETKQSEKVECFTSLGIPSNFPVQLE